MAKYDSESDIVAWTIGSGILLIQVCVVIPGLLPCLILLLPLAVPFLVLGLLGGVVVGIGKAVRKVF